MLKTAFIHHSSTPALYFPPFPLAPASPIRLGTGVILSWFLAALAVLSLALLLWQWIVAVRFPLHERSADLRIGTKQGAPGPDTPNRSSAPRPPVTLLKPLKGCDASTEDCLRSWFAQKYNGEIQILCGVAAADDPVCEVVHRLMRENPTRDAQLIICGLVLGANAKVSTLAQLEKLAKHEIWVISDADVRVPPDLLANAVMPLYDSDGRAGSPLPAALQSARDGAHGVTRPTGRTVGLVNCFYRLANPATLAMQWEAIAINADFWSQVLQSQSLKPLDFALGAVMVTRRKPLEEIGGFKALTDCLADDYQLGNRIARKGYRIALCPVVAECWDPPTGWSGVWKHQLRWARTIRVCQPLPYFFSILSNAGFWAMLWLIAALPFTTVTTTTLSTAGSSYVQSSVIEPVWEAKAALACCFIRMLCAYDLQRRLTRSSKHTIYFWLVPIKDLLQAVLWLCAFAGNRIEWRGQKFELRRDGTLKKN